MSTARLAFVARVLLVLGGLLFVEATASTSWLVSVYRQPDVHRSDSVVTDTWRIALDGQEECLAWPGMTACWDPDESGPQSCMAFRFRGFTAVTGTLTIGACLLLVAVAVVLLTRISSRSVPWRWLAVAITLVATPGALFVANVKRVAESLELDEGAYCFLGGLVVLALALRVMSVHAARATQDARVATAIVTARGRVGTSSRSRCQSRR